jgi:hypothetical protein
VNRKRMCRSHNLWTVYPEVDFCIFRWYLEHVCASNMPQQFAYLQQNTHTHTHTHTHTNNVSTSASCITVVFLSLTYRSFATRASQLKIWHFWVIGIERNVCRCTFNRYSAMTQFAKLAAVEQLCHCCTHRKL